MIIAVIGSRDYKNLFEVTNYLNSIKGKIDFELITGNAKGVDETVKKWADLNNVKCEVVKPANLENWNKSICCIFRNIEIIIKADLIIAFWNGSRGTKFVIDYARARMKPIEVKGYEKWAYHQ